MKKINYLIVFIILGAFLTQSFQCTSPTMSTARTANKNKDYKKSIEAYEKELKANPTNAEAHYELAAVLLTDIEDSKPDLATTIKAIDKSLDHAFEGRKMVKDQKNAEKYFDIENNIWIYSFNCGSSALNEISKPELSAEEKISIVKSVEPILEKSIKLIPYLPNTYYMLGLIYTGLGDFNKAISAYDGYNKVLSNELKFAKEKGISLSTTRDELLSKLGKPAQVIPHYWRYNTTPKGQIHDTLNTYIFNANNAMLAVWTYFNPKENTNKVIGWIFNPLPALFQQRFDILIEPSVNLFSIVYDIESAKEPGKGDFSKAIQTYETIKILDPNYSNANQFLVEIYKLQGNKDKALEVISKLVKENPENKVTRAQYGDILKEFDREDEAIAQYEAALKMDPNYTIVKKILGSTYKNKAAKILDIEREKYIKDNKYVVKTEEFMPFLDKSANYFESALKDADSENDYVIMYDLADIYFVKQQTDKKYADMFNSMVSKMELIERNIVETELTQYYYNLLNLYDRTGNSEKSEVIQKKIQALK